MTTSVQAAPENAPKQFGLGVRMRGFSVHQSLKSQARQSGNIVLNQSSLSQNLTNMDDPLAEAVPRSFSGGWGWACTGCGVNLGFVGWLGYRLSFGACLCFLVSGLQGTSFRVLDLGERKVILFELHRRFEPLDLESNFFNLTTKKPKPQALHPRALNP